MRRLLLTLVVIAASALPAGAAASADHPAPGDAGAAISSAAFTSAASTSAGSKTKAKKRSLRKCRKIKRRAKRKRCVRKVKKKYSAAKVPAQGPVGATIDVRDKYFSPAIVSIKSGQSILWVWNAVNADAHNVNLADGPKGVSRVAFSTPSSPSVGFQFRRTFKVAGTYNFVCSIHHNMTMRVEVSK